MTPRSLSSFLVLASVVLLSLSVCACAASSQASAREHAPNKDGHRHAAEEYLSLLNPEVLADAYLPTYLDEVGEARSNLDREEYDELRAKMVDILRSDEVRRHLVELYLVRFTREELEELARFYRTSAGRKLLEEAPEVMNASARIAAGALAAALPSREGSPDEPPAQETAPGTSIYRPHRLDESGTPLAPLDVAVPPEDASCTASGLCYRFLRKPGANSPQPTPESRVTVHYTGWSKDGTMFDSSVARGKPATFGVHQVIRGWTEGLQLMPEGSAIRLWIPAELAYGETPRRPGAPAGQLTFDIHLLEIEDD